jgi:ribonucleotide reductase beta subunit family protein with ferritin-like domain
MSSNILAKFSDEIQVPEARCFLGFQQMQQNIHMELLTVLLDAFSNTTQERDDLLELASERKTM